jgi:uncharacterized HAD superfamily protein
MVKEKLKIGIDIDEVVCAFVEEFLVFCSLKFGRKIKYEDVTDYYFENALKLSKEDILPLFDEFNRTEHFYNLGLIEGAKESIKFLSEKNEIHFITSRPLSLKEKTIYFLKEHFSEFDFLVHFSSDVFGGEKSKLDICSELGIDYFVEDNGEFALNCSENGIKVFLLNKLWNQDYEHENIIRVKNWGEILERLNEN